MAAVVFAAAGTSAAAQTGGAAQVCTLRALLVFRAGEVTALRTRPDPRSKATYRIPWRRGGVVATVAGGRGVWFRVRRLTTISGLALPRLRPGWIHGARLALWLRGVGGRGVPLYDDPDPKTAVSARLNRRLLRRPGVVMGCHKTWARVRVGRIIGWVPAANQCLRARGRCR